MSPLKASSQVFKKTPFLRKNGRNAGCNAGTAHCSMHVCFLAAPLRFCKSRCDPGHLEPSSVRSSTCSGAPLCVAPRVYVRATSVHPLGS